MSVPWQISESEAALSQPKIKLAVIVSGGVVQGVATDSPALVDVVVCDHDDFKDEGLDEYEAEESVKFEDGSSVADLTETDLWVY